MLVVVTATATTVAGFSLGWFYGYRKAQQKSRRAPERRPLLRKTPVPVPSTFSSDRLPDQIVFDRGLCVAPSAMEASK